MRIQYPKRREASVTNLKIKPMNTIQINTPKEVNSKRVKKEVEKLIKSGIKTNEINLQMNFICDAPDLILNDFRKLKNHIAFNNN